MLYTANVVELDLRVLNAVHPGPASIQILIILNACETWHFRVSASEYPVMGFKRMFATPTILSRDWSARIGAE